MAAGQNNYEILLSAVIDEKQIKTQLDAIANKYVINLKVNVDDKGLGDVKAGIGEVQKEAEKKKVTIRIDTQSGDKSLVALKQRIEEIKKATGTDAVKYTIFTDIGKNGEKIQRAVLTYSDGISKTVQETLKWKTTTKEVGDQIQKISKWQVTNKTYVDDIAKATKSRLQEEKKVNTELEKAVHYADKFLERAKGLSKTTEVKKGMATAQQIQTLGTDPKNIDQVRNLRKELEVLDSGIKQSGVSAWNWGKQIGVAIQRTIEWAGAVGLVYGALRQIREGIQYVTELNKEMVNIQAITGMNNDQINSLASDYNSLAKELSATTLEVSRSSVEWIRQGKTVDETKELVKASMMLSKLGAMDSAAATEALTSTLNSYKISAEDAVKVVDKLVAVDAQAATSSEELVQALRRTSSFAQLAGVDLDTLIGYIATVSSISRKSSETIGTSFQAMFSRLTNIKLGSIDEETGQSLNDVEEVLGRLGIKLRDSEDSFRDMDEVLKDVAGRWRELSDTEKAAVSQAIAGTRQRENFVILMEHFNDALKYQEIATNSAGKSLERYQAYLEGIEAAQNRFTASWEKLASNTINSDMIKFFLNFGSSLLDLTDTIGLFNIAIVALGAYMATKLVITLPLVTGAIDALAVSMGLATGAATTLSLALTGGLIGIAVIGAIAAFQALSTNVKETYDSFQKLRSVSEDNQNELKSLAKEYEDLANKQDRTAEETTRLLDIQTILNTKYGASTDGINTYTDAINGNTEAIKKNIEWMNNKAKQEAQSFVDKNKYMYDEAKKYLEDPYTMMTSSGKSITYDSAKEYVKHLEEQIEKGEDIFGIQRKTRDEILAQIDAAQKLVIEYEHFENVLEGMDAGEQASSRTVAPLFGLPSPEEIPQYQGLIETIKKLREETQLFYDLSQKQAEGTFNYEDVTKLLELDKENVKLLEIENGLIELNTDKVRELTIAKAKDALETAKKNDASEEEIAILENYVEQVERAIPLSREFSDTFQTFLEGAAQQSGGDSAVTKLLTDVYDVSQQFENGKISASSYFSLLQEQVSKVDMKETFGDNQEAAQLFFTGLVTNATQSLSQITSMFNAGEMTLTEYTSSLTELSGVFTMLGEMQLNYADTLGLSAEAAEQMKSAITGALGEIATGTTELANLQEMTSALEQTYFEINQQGLEWGTEAYTEYMRTIANAAMATGQTFTDMNGNIIRSGEEMFQYLNANSNNINLIARQAANKTGTAMRNILKGAAGLLKNFAESIRTFKAEINFAPRATGQKTKIPVSVMGMPIDNFIEVPNLTLDITGSSTSMSGIADSLSSFSDTLTNGLDDMFNFDEDLFQVPGGTNQPVGKTEELSGAYKDLEDAIKDAGDAAKKAADEQKKALDDLLKKIKKVKELEKEALKEKLAAYKKLIDAQKKALDQQEKQKDYEEEVEEQQKNILDLRNELAELALDDSEEARARKKQLEEELAKLEKKLAETQREKSIDDQKEALDQEYELFKEKIDKEIDAIEDFLDQLATIEAKTIEELIKKLEAIGITVNIESGTIETHHSGANSGFVGGQALSNASEQFARLMRGEFVLNKSDMDNFMSKTLPSLMSVPQFTSNNAGGTGFTIENLIRIDGNATPDIIPNIERIANQVVEKLNNAMTNKGFPRRVNSFGG
jgi:TP901 family phage tail tape measure protein